MTRRALAARAAIVALGAALVAIAAADAVNPQYHPLSETVSRYVNGTAGWLISGAILALAAASAVVVVLLRVVQGSGWGKAALAVWAAGVLIAGVFPADPPGRWTRPSTSEMVHGTAAWVAFAVFPVAAVVLARPLAALWPRGRRCLIGTAIATVPGTIALAIFLADVMVDGPSLGFGGVPTLLGLVERLLIVLNAVWLALAAAAASDSDAVSAAAGRVKS
ncbi:DUF998 domain-containing protein [Dactylosporangium sp. CA-052675]|uniref:DUF998 domain-containing protein n=1 Tax=Dactylosporangium sp. CA-052675 TaxID=3239927 RepID=UPI003D93F96C